MTSDRSPAAPQWAARAEALAGHATSKWAAGCAAVSLAAFLVAAAMLLTDALYWPGAEIFRLVASMFIGPLGLALSVVVLNHRSGRLSAPEALLTAAAAIPACGLAAAAAVSWSAGFTAADAGVALNWFEAAALPLLAAAVIAGTAALLPTINGVWSPRRSLASRTVQSLVLAAPAALALIIAFLIGSLFAPFAAVWLLVAALRAESAARPLSQVRPEPRPRTPLPAAAPSVEPATRFPASRGVHTAVAVMAAGTLLFGLLCVAFAVSGSTWSGLAADPTAAMNLGLAAGALNAVPLTVAAGMLLLPWLGSVIRWTVLLMCCGFLFEAAAQFAGAGHPWQWPLTLAGAVLLGCGIVLPFGRFVPGPALLRLGVMVGGGLAAAIVGVFIVAGAGFIAPLVSAVLLVWCFLPAARQRALPQPA